MIEQVDMEVLPTFDEGPVEMAVWEQDKENIRPSRGGRDPAKLAEAVLCQRSSDEQLGSTKTFDEARRLEREDFESRLALLADGAASSTHVAGERGLVHMYTMVSLVQLWCDYARWAAEWYPSNSQEERSVLERATSFLAERPSCFGDIQHLRLWLRRADLIQEPQEIFNFLWARSIGLEHAVFYEAWATSLERQRRFNEAEEVLNIARARGAQPADRLVALSEALAARMRGRVLRSAEDGDGVAADEILVPAPLQRPALNVLTAAESQGLARPSERRVVQGSTLGLDSGAAIAGLPGEPIACLHEAAAGELSRCSIFDARSTWALPPPKESAAFKENASSRVRMIDAVTSVSRSRRRNADRQNGPETGSDETGLAIFVDEELRDQDLSPPARRMRTTGSVPSQQTLPNETCGLCQQQPVPASGTPPHLARLSPLPTETNSATRAARAPPRMNRDGQRRRPVTDLADDLADGLSSLSIGNFPPAKRARGLGLMAFGDAPPRLPQDSEVRDAEVVGLGQDMYCDADVAPRSHGMTMETTDLMCTPIRPQSLRNALFGDSSGRGPPPVEPSDASLQRVSPQLLFCDSIPEGELALASGRFGPDSHACGSSTGPVVANLRGSASSCGMGMGRLAQLGNSSFKKKDLLGHCGSYGGSRPTNECLIGSSSRLLIFEDTP